MARLFLLPMFAGLALVPVAAQANTCTAACSIAVEQIASATSYASVSQSGFDSTAQVTQSGPGRNAATLTQSNPLSGAGDTAAVAQSGAAANRFTGSQTGSGNQLTVVQAALKGADVAGVDQLGNGNSAAIYQNYSPLSGAYTSGGANYAYIYQGPTLYGVVTSDQATIQQTGSNDVASIAQYGSHDSASITQSGSNDTATYTQVGSNLGDIGIKQTGSYMTVSVTQTPAFIATFK